MSSERSRDPEPCACCGEPGETTRVGPEWSEWSQRVAHPDSPAGGGGPGYFSSVALRQDRSDLPSPSRPGPLTAIPLQGAPAPVKPNLAPVTMAEQLGVLKDIQNEMYDVHVEAEIVADGGAPPGQGAKTTFKGGSEFASPQGVTSGNKVTSFKSKFVWKGTIKIQTAYASDADPNQSSCYGRGTTDADIKVGNITLGFHESCHRDDYKGYLKSNKLPDPPAFSVGMTIKEYNQAHAAFEAALKAYFESMESESVANTDEVGYPLSRRKSTKKCFKHVVP